MPIDCIIVLKRKRVLKNTNKNYIIGKEMRNIEKNKLTMKNDIMFKAFFSKKENEKFLKSFLSAILGEEVKIKRVIHDARLEQLTREQKYGILDLEVELENGEYVNIEMQLKNNNNMEERTTFYASKKITEQMVKGRPYKDLNKVIIISILDYNLINLPEYITKTVRVADKHREYEINNKVEFYYIELKKFREENPDMKEPINQWLAFIDMEKGEWLEMAKKENKEIEEAVEEYETLTGDALVKRIAEIRLMSELEEQSALENAKNEGIEQGKREGLKQSKIETAKKLLKLKMPIEQIIEITELTKEEIEKL